MLRICNFSVLALHETLLILILMYGNETMLWKEERFRIRAVQMDNLKGLLGSRRMDRVLNAWIRKLCGMKKEVNERILWWFSHVEKMENDIIAKSLYRRVCW